MGGFSTTSMLLFQSLVDDITEFGTIMFNIQFCDLYLTNYHVKFIKRQANEVTHDLASIVTSLTNSRIVSDIPSYII